MANKTTGLLTPPRLAQEISKSHKVSQDQFEVNQVPTQGFKVYVVKTVFSTLLGFQLGFPELLPAPFPIKGDTAIGE